MKDMTYEEFKNLTDEEFIKLSNEDIDYLLNKFNNLPVYPKITIEKLFLKFNLTLPLNIFDNIKFFEVNDIYTEGKENKYNYRFKNEYNEELIINKNNKQDYLILRNSFNEISYTCFGLLNKIS